MNYCISDTQFAACNDSGFICIGYVNGTISVGDEVCLYSDEHLKTIAYVHDIQKINDNYIKDKVINTYVYNEENCESIKSATNEKCAILLHSYGLDVGIVDVSENIVIIYKDDTPSFIDKYHLDLWKNDALLSIFAKEYANHQYDEDFVHLFARYLAFTKIIVPVLYNKKSKNKNFISKNGVMKIYTGIYTFDFNKNDTVPFSTFIFELFNYIKNKKLVMVYTDDGKSIELPHNFIDRVKRLVGDD